MPSNFVHCSHSLQLWFSKVSDATINFEQTTKSHLSPSERKRYRATNSINKQREFLLSRALMRHALSQHFLHPENYWDFIDRPNSPPIISNLPENIYISLTHSKGHICFAISKDPVGIDLESYLKQRDFLSLAETFMNDEEIEYLKQDTDTQGENFYRIWTAKEAFYKAIPSYEQLSTSLKEISVSTLICNDKDWFLIERKNEKFILSVVIKNNPKKISYNHFPPTNSPDLFR